MTEQQPPQPSMPIAMELPDALAGGVYANIVGVWHTPTEFTLDFAVTQPPAQMAGPDGEPVSVVPARVVARVKLPPSQVFALASALTTNEKLYEGRFGPIVQPGRPENDLPLYPPTS